MNPVVSVYVLTLSDGSAYVGSTVNPARRLRQHRHNLKIGRHRSSDLQDRYNQLGDKRVHMKIVLETSQETRYQDEQSAIDSLGTSVMNASRVASNAMKDPSCARRQVASIASGSGKDVRAENIKSVRARPGYKERLLSAIRSPAAREMNSKRMKQKWADPNYRAMMMARRQKSV